jgi:hypothetical protein
MQMIAHRCRCGKACVSIAGEELRDELELPPVFHDRSEAAGGDVVEHRFVERGLDGRCAAKKRVNQRFRLSR